MPLNAQLAGITSGQNRFKRPKAQAIELQTLIMAEAKNTETPASVLAQLARAWTDLEECKRKLAMKPLPGSLRPTAQPKKKRAAPAQPVEPASVQPAPVQPSAPPLPKTE